jgi:hypothetical protein
MSSICNQRWRFFLCQPGEDSIYEKRAWAVMHHDASDQEIADNTLYLILNNGGDGEVNKSSLDGIIDEQSWTEEIAKAVLYGLATAIKEGKNISEDVRKISDVAYTLAQKFFLVTEKHPEATMFFCTIAAVAVLSLLAPWILELLGFAAEGPVAGKQSSPNVICSVC